MPISRTPKSLSRSFFFFVFFFSCLSFTLFFFFLPLCRPLLRRFVFLLCLSSSHVLGASTTSFLPSSVPPPHRICLLPPATQFSIASTTVRSRRRRGSRIGFGSLTTCCFSCSTESDTMRNWSDYVRAPNGPICTPSCSSALVDSRESLQFAMAWIKRRRR